ncbi:unnamed protein product [Peronospora farinosa]|uniref:Uncharacterized protein n=1 Tax=Peronospora farinosa TaxID=134698 RepID=A0AAV0TPF9_9STRA|nr:unnamed protein product [Peronospora farinosa]CAI5725329.1 unnamed protein product [Peronospora farinosa]
MASEENVLATLPLPPSAFPDYPLVSGTTPTSDKETTIERRPSRSKLPASAVKASSAARSLAAAARSKLSIKNGRNTLSPGDKSDSSTLSDTEEESRRSSDSLTLMASAAGSLTSGFTSSLANASSSFGSMLYSSRRSSVNNIDDVDESRTSTIEEAAAVAAQVLQQVNTQQRMTILEHLVQDRRSDWYYLKIMHEGSNYWLNVALLREQEVMKYLGDKQSIRRGTQFFYLGLGLGKLVGDSMHGKQLAIECCQLLEELEFHFSSSTVQGMKMMVATSSTLHEPLDKKNSLEFSSDEPFRPIMHKWNQRPVYRRLMTPPIPFPLDYREVLLSLCDILALVYSKLIGDSSASENVNVFQAIIRFDDRIKKLVIDPVKKEFSAVASQVMAEEMRLVRKSYASGARDSEGSSCTTSVSVTASDPDNASSFSQ